MASAEQKPMIGIDLGTTNSVFSIVKHGQVMVLKNREGEWVNTYLIMWSNLTITIKSCFSFLFNLDFSDNDWSIDSSIFPVHCFVANATQDYQNRPNPTADPD